MPDIQDLYYREMPTIQVSSCGKSGCKDKAVASAEEEQVSYYIFQKFVLKSMGFKYIKYGRHSCVSIERHLCFIRKPFSFPLLQS